MNDDNATEAERLRHKYSAEIPDGLDVESREVFWITKYVVFTEAKNRAIIASIFGDSAVDDLADWNSHWWPERSERQNWKSEKQNIEKAQKAFETLRACFDEDFALKKHFSVEGDGISEDPMYLQAFGWIEQRLALVRRCGRYDSNQFESNYISNRSAAILDIWPALETEGFGFRPAARIIAEAFKQAGLESGDDKRREDSIYQAIRNVVKNRR